MSQSDSNDTSSPQSRSVITCPQCGNPLEHDFLHKQGWTKTVLGDTLTPLGKSLLKSAQSPHHPLTIPENWASEDSLKEISSLKERNEELYAQHQKDAVAKQDATERAKKAEAANARVEKKLKVFLEIMEATCSTEPNTKTRSKFEFFVTFIKKHLKFSEEK